MTKFTARMSLSVILPLAMAGTALAAPTGGPDPVRGSKLFLQCAACHSVQPGGPNTVGPNLAGISGAKAATRPGYQYSAALTKSGLVWNSAALDAFLKRPSQVVPGTKMAFGGVADAKARTDLIAYLATLKARK